jgi:hypothetical protein
LLYHTYLNKEKENSARVAARNPLDFLYKGQRPTVRILNAGAAQINGKHGDNKYLPDTEKHSRPDHGYDARIDTTILDAVRAKYVDVSGLLIPNYQLQKKCFFFCYCCLCQCFCCGCGCIGLSGEGKEVFPWSLALRARFRSVFISIIIEVALAAPPVAIPPAAGPPAAAAAPPPDDLAYTKPAVTPRPPSGCTGSPDVTGQPERPSGRRVVRSQEMALNTGHQCFKGGGSE